MCLKKKKKKMINADADDEDDCLLNVWMFLCFSRMPRGFLRSGGICTHK